MINAVLNENGESQRLQSINIATLKALLELCQAFDYVYKKMQVSNSPLCFVIPSIDKIKTICGPNNSDIPEIVI